MKDFFIQHFDAFITILITVIGFVVTYFGTKRGFKNEIAKEKISHNIETIQTLPYEICELLTSMHDNKIDLEKYKQLMSKIIAYGSKDAVSLAIHMQQIAYISNKREQTKEEQWEMLVTYSLLITQFKYDLTSEIISPESWFQLKVNDYSEEMRISMIEIINKVIDELNLNKNFKITKWEGNK